MSDAQFMIAIAGSLKQYAGHDPEELPVILLHESGWHGKPFVDTANRIHMNAGQLEILKNMVPVEEVKRHAKDVVEFRIALERHHLDGGVNDNAPLVGEARHDLIKDAVGLNPDFSDKIDEKAEAERVEEVFEDAVRPPREV